ncbi:hypothetical protein ACX27_17730 [Nostoc piscinale CENA21]|uniref:PEP-CTERM sorting domain-containing protein n=1 Tax=Nostoc piscinale CENA21 TaxID=224013 RepID=A0A0M4SST9_9NOSO|nr:PEP-CTERM sorting domain-containing protein [Nostoc piscinale]ALF54265.1 hypothetical protein ACX27_17730 [Nostoc piscinale CENA21]
MNRKSLAVFTAAFALMCSVITTKAEAFSITPDKNGLTFILDEEKNSLKAIRGLEVLDKKYDVNFITGNFEDLSPTNRGITTFYTNANHARQAGISLRQSLINFHNSSGNLVSKIEDIDGNLSHQWNIPFVFSDALGAGWWRGVIDNHNIGLFPIAPINASTFYFTELTYANFQPSTKASVPEPLNILGSLTAAGFGIAIKRKFVSMRQD